MLTSNPFPNQGYIMQWDLVNNGNLLKKNHFLFILIGIISLKHMYVYYMVKLNNVIEKMTNLFQQNDYTLKPFKCTYNTQDDWDFTSKHINILTQT